MSELSRIGITIPTELLDQFDRAISAKDYASRSEAVRDMIRDTLIQKSVGEGRGEVIGTLTLVYDHHARQLSEKLTGMQHQHHSQIVSTVHVHLDHHNCLEVIILRGRGSDIQAIANGLIATKGVRHGKLTVTSASA